MLSQCSLAGVKRTPLRHAVMSASDPTRTSPTLVLPTAAVGFMDYGFAGCWAKQQAAIPLSKGSSLFLMRRRFEFSVRGAVLGAELV